MVLPCLHQRRASQDNRCRAQGQGQGFGCISQEHSQEISGQATVATFGIWAEEGRATALQGRGGQEGPKVSYDGGRPYSHKSQRAQGETCPVS